ncbi:beta galactosidase jelly roll domain-containing protein [Prevotella sp. 10(H)]|uniref:beta galactosidase jelly roll domain-containing protein n=1 Tax=Prevotella sp. 10(H) TaxID=1158294 RepID=UPI0004A6F76F|nr:beta galactosidase jelly roll domain-containing protein [Prevotella sp. 10(H)]
MKRIINIISILLFCIVSPAQNIDLKGVWKFKMDPEDVGLMQNWQTKDFDETVQLPGSMATNDKGFDISMETNWTGKIVDSAWFNDNKYAKYRQKDNLKSVFWLQPNKSYVGVAWYNTKFQIPESTDVRNYIVSLERPHWETTVWVDGYKIGMQNSLGTPHEYILSNLKNGEHILTIRVDNRIEDIDVGINAHSVSDHTQTNWNGIAGNITIKARPIVFIENVQVYPDIDKKEIKVIINVDNRSQTSQKSVITLNAKSKFTPTLHQLPELSIEKEFSSGLGVVEVTYPMGESFYKWDEFEPYLYELDTRLASGPTIDKFQTNFGMRKLGIKGTQFIINDKTIFLRGTLDCAAYPLTGYPPTNVPEWKRILNVIKKHGLNHVRFHSWCPPKAAFEAADELGVYLQVEGNGWTTVGNGSKFDKWIYDESERILRSYGNHPSFILYTYGNEPGGGNQSRFLGDLVIHLKKYDSRHFYTSGAGWPDIPENEFYNNGYPRLFQWGSGLKSHNNANPPSTDFDWYKMIEKYNIPYVSHEIGQWCVYPNFKEIDKYTGVLKAKNFEIFQETLKDNGLDDLADSFLLASGKHQALTYKAEIEAALRTKGFAGFQLLGLNDFPGQGTALVGVLDAFWEEKGYVTAEEFNQFSGHTVPLVRLPKMTYVNNEVLEAPVEVAHFGYNELKNVSPQWRLINTDGKIIGSGSLNKQNIPIGNCIKLGTIRQSLQEISEPVALKLIVEIGNNSNSWDIWVYPESDYKPNNNILIADKLDTEVIRILEQGGKVLLSPKKGSIKKEFGGDVVMGYSPIFWNTAWSRKQPPLVMGILTDPQHPAFRLFPTEYHSNYQWWAIMMNSNAIRLNILGDNFQPIVRVIDDWFSNQSLGLIIEAQVGKGKIIISGADLLSNPDNRPEIKQMKNSLINYMDMESFNPANKLNIDILKKMFN